MKLSLFLGVLIALTSRINGGSEEAFPKCFHSHEMLQAIPSQAIGSQVDDLALVKRITQAYQRGAKHQENRGDSMWQLFFDQYHKGIHQILLNGETDTIANILHNPASSNMFFGFDSLTSSAMPEYEIPFTKLIYSKLCLDGLVRFAETIGAIPANNSASWHSDDILQKLEQIVPDLLIFPNPYPYEHGVWSSFGIISYRVPQALYQAWFLTKLLKGVQHPRVLEIGAGLGRTAFYAKQLGIEDYTIVDLPFTAVSSGYFLGRTLGEDQILFSGENASDAKFRIKIITPEEFLMSGESYDLIFNADGLTEMDPKIAKAYWQRIEQICPIFVSINHELNSYTIKELIDSSTNVIEMTRMLYPMRQGYFEEIVRFMPKP